MSKRGAVSVAMQCNLPQINVDIPQPPQLQFLCDRTAGCSRKREKKTEYDYAADGWGRMYQQTGTMMVDTADQQTGQKGDEEKGLQNGELQDVVKITKNAYTVTIQRNKEMHWLMDAWKEEGQLGMLSL